MAQILLLGLGGTGSRVVNRVVKDLKKKNISFNDGQICCTVLDTDTNDMDKIVNTGTGVPVVPTSKDRKIKDYLDMYKDKGVRNWMPESPALLKDRMIDGASQMRVKSRLALMDIIEDRTIRQLEEYIDRMFDQRDESKIRVMLVSSLAGGTGSGMFIQAALWLRKYFETKRCAVTIRGIFLLPDIFVKTNKEVDNDTTETQSMYANAYAAVRELNAIDKISEKGMVPMMPIKLDGLFDSDVSRNNGHRVLDYAFFVDYTAEDGSNLTQLSEYEELVSRLVYMQMFAPMYSALYSQEDNLFKRFQKSQEPVYGSCGTAKAIYPADDIMRYCALRAAQDSLSTGWRSIDDEIKAKQKKEDEKIENGELLTQRLEPRHEFVRLFESKTERTDTQVGKNRMFVNIALDVKNEERVPGEKGTVDMIYTCKVEDFKERLNNLVASTIDSFECGGLAELGLYDGWAESDDDSSKEALLSLVESKQTDVESFLEYMDANAEKMAEDLADTICGTDMGDINIKNINSVYGFLTKKDSNDQPYFVHPLAVRYLLYKLLFSMDEIKDEIVINAMREAAKKGYGQGKKPISFDNPRTRKAEGNPVEFLNSKAFLQSEEKRLDSFRALYAQFNAAQAELCRAFAIGSVKYQLVMMLAQRLEKLVSGVESFFKNLVKVSNTLEDAVADNIRKNEGAQQKTIYVCASRQDKEALYKSLRFNTGNSDANLNAVLVNALYGQFCATENPGAVSNQQYKDRSVENIFYKEVTEIYSKILRTQHKDEVDLDIYSAICKSADMAYEMEEERRRQLEQELDRLDVDLETGESNRAEERHNRHMMAIKAMTVKLSKMASPFIISTDEIPEDKDEHLMDSFEEEDSDAPFTPIRKRKTFWGFHPVVVEKCPKLGAILGINAEQQMNSAYSKNELDCYRAVYGIQIGCLRDFNEVKNGKYFRSYKEVVKDLVNGVADGRTEDLIYTPHLDKTWHLYLPYVTPEMQQAEDSKFYRQFWLALAYGVIFLDAHGKYQIKRTKKIATGSYEHEEPVVFHGETIGKTGVMELIAALRMDGTFRMEAARAEKLFASECNKLDNYEGTQFLRGSTVGGLASQRETNALTMILRYHNTPRHSEEVTAMLIQSLEQLCCELVSNKYELNEQSKIRHKGFELCKRIHDASSLSGKSFRLIEHWRSAWSRKTLED